MTKKTDKIQLICKLDKDTSRLMGDYLTLKVNLLNELWLFLEKAEKEGGIFVPFDQEGFNTGNFRFTRTIGDKYAARVDEQCGLSGLSRSQFSHALFRHIYLKCHESNKENKS